jgi:hypothetical protein
MMANDSDAAAAGEIDKEELPLNICEVAKSDRSRCGSCKKPIIKGSQRIGVRRWAPFRKKGSGYLMVRWHHPECIPAPGSLTIAGSISQNYKEKEEAGASLQIQKFGKAARFAVRKQISDFGNRMLSEAASPLSCPFTGELLESKRDNTRILSKNANVHHFGPEDFKAILQGFIQTTGIDLNLVSYVSGPQFANADLEQEFCKYHGLHARLLLISAHANQSVVKRHPTIGPCDYCKVVGSLKWIFREGMCGYCGDKKSIKQMFPSQQMANKMFSLKPPDLQDLECQLMPNPKNSGFSPMKLYRMKDLETAATRKYDSVDAAKSHVKSRNAQCKKRRAKYYESAKSFHIHLRSKKTHTIAEEIGCEDFATYPQLYFLRILKLDVPIGLSKKHASERIDSELKRRKMSKMARKLSFLESAVATEQASSTKKDEHAKDRPPLLARDQARSAKKSYYATPFLAFVEEQNAISPFNQYAAGADRQQSTLPLMWRLLSDEERREYQQDEVNPQKGGRLPVKKENS